MSNTTKISHRAETAKGGMKKNVGRLLGNRRLQALGRRDQAKSRARQLGARIRNAFRT